MGCYSVPCLAVVMSIRSFWKKIAGRAGKASRSTRGAHSHVNTRRNKRASSKALRGYTYCPEVDCTGQEINQEHSHRANEANMLEQTIYRDWHLDVPDEIRFQEEDPLDPHGYDDMPSVGLDLLTDEEPHGDR